MSWSAGRQNGRTAERQNGRTKPWEETPTISVASQRGPKGAILAEGHKAKLQNEPNWDNRRNFNWLWVAARPRGSDIGSKVTVRTMDSCSAAASPKGPISACDKRWERSRFGRTNRGQKRQ